MKENGPKSIKNSNTVSQKNIVPKAVSILSTQYLQLQLGQKRIVIVEEERLFLHTVDNFQDFPQ